MPSSPGTQAQPLSPRASSGHIPRRWLPPARGAWGICALRLLANVVASIPAYYQLLRTVCPLPDQGDCTDGRIAPRWSWLVLSFWILTFAQSAFLPFPKDMALLLLENLVVFGGTLFILVYRYVRVFNATERQQAK